MPSTVFYTDKGRIQRGSMIPWHHKLSTMVSITLPPSQGTPLQNRDRPAGRNICDRNRQHTSQDSTRQCVLVALDWIRDKDPSTSLGLGSIAAAVQQVAPTKELYFNVSTGKITPEDVAHSVIQSAGAPAIQKRTLCVSHF